MLEAAKEKIRNQAVKGAIHYLSKNPERNLDRLTRLALNLAVQENHKQQIAQARQYLVDPSSNWHQLVVKTFKETNEQVRDRLLFNFVVNSVLHGIPKQQKLAAEFGFSVPWAILFDPTDRCNLKCRGCWAGEYRKRNDLPYEEMDRIVTEGESLGIHFYVVSGGEPLLCKEELLNLARSHPNSVFHIFTNATLIDDDFASRVVECGNMVFALSIEGFEESTDARRGKGTFAQIMKAADILREHGLVFGFSTTYTRQNVQEVMRDEYIDMLIDQGFRFGWLFTYVPVGADCDLEYMATPEQREQMYHKVKEWRQTKPIFIADFWNDGAATQGCIAGGRRYFHINAAGEAEPCAFVHYSAMNIKGNSLIKILGNPLFRAYQKRQPFNDNMLRPCPIIDNPHKLVEVVEESQAYSTQVVPVSVQDLAASLEEYAVLWGQRADQIWSQETAGSLNNCKAV